MRQDSLPIPGLAMAAIAIAAVAVRPIQFVAHAAAVIVLLCSVFLPIRLRLTGRSFTIASALLLVPFLLWTLVTKLSMPASAGPYAIAFVALYRISLYFISVMLLLAYKEREKSDASRLLSLALLAIIFGGFTPGPLYVPALIPLTLLTIFYCISIEHSGLRGRSLRYWMGMAFSIVLLCGSSFGMAWFFKWTETKVNTMFMMTLAPMSFSPAFSVESKITAIDDLKGSGRVVLRIFSNSHPYYLVGKVFEQFTDRNTWKARKQSRLIHPLQDEPARGQILAHFPQARGRVFHTGAPGDLQEDLKQAKGFMSIVITSVNTETLFAPRGTRFMVVSSENIRTDSGGVLYTSVKDTRGEYQLGAIIDSNFENTEVKDFSPWLELPGNIPEKIRALNRELTAESRGPWDTSQTLLTFFHTRFHYGPAPHLKNQKELLENFLLTSRQGHCEFFATAMTILLRMNGIPARYVNGFLVEERNSMGGYYVVREKNAHAWVEAYIPDKGWVTLDPTPPLGRTPPEDSLIPLKLREFYDIIMLKIYNLKARLFAGDILGSLKWLIEQIKSSVVWLAGEPVRFALFVLAMALFVVYRLGGFQFITFFKRRHQEKHREPDLPAEFRILGENLQQFEQLLAAKKIKRSPEVTLLEFSKSIPTLPEEKQKAIGEFLEAYCAIRFGRERIEAGDLEELKKKLAEVTSILKKSTTRNL